MRLFVGLPLPDAAVDALYPILERIPAGTPVPEENLHLTLAFLDDQPAAMLPELDLELRSLKAAPMALSFSGVSLLGGASPRVFVATVENDAELTRLHNGVRRAAQALDIHLPRRRFRPHVTLARLPRRASADMLRGFGLFLGEIGELHFADFEVDRFSLYQSSLLPDGARYDILADYPLSG